jgi:hypothetical protein
MTTKPTREFQMRKQKTKQNQQHHDRLQVPLLGKHCIQTRKGKFGRGVEVRQEQVKRNYRAAVQYLDLTENGNTPGTIGFAEEIFKAYGDTGSGCTGLIIGIFMIGDW